MKRRPLTLALSPPRRGARGQEKRSVQNRPPMSDGTRTGLVGLLPLDLYRLVQQTFEPLATKAHVVPFDAIGRQECKNHRFMTEWSDPEFVVRLRRVSRTGPARSKQWNARGSGSRLFADQDRACRERQLFIGRGQPVISRSSESWQVFGQLEQPRQRDTAQNETSTMTRPDRQTSSPPAQTSPVRQIVTPRHRAGRRRRLPGARG